MLCGHLLLWHCVPYTGSFLRGRRSQLLESPATQKVLDREHAHSRYNISGNIRTDFLTTCCYPVCDLIQEPREIELEEAARGKLCNLYS